MQKIKKALKKLAISNLAAKKATPVKKKTQALPAKKAPAKAVKQAAPVKKAAAKPVASKGKVAAPAPKGKDTKKDAS
ncbi:MAG: histone H1, partial [Proteobacteria bacterium]